MRLHVFFFPSLLDWFFETVTRVERQHQQIRGFPPHGLQSPRQHSWVDKHWARAYQRISQEVWKVFLLCCCRRCYSSGCQPGSVYRWKQVRLLYLLASVQSTGHHLPKDMPKRRHSWCDCKGFPKYKTLQSGMFCAFKQCANMLKIIPTLFIWCTLPDAFILKTFQVQTSPAFNE